MRNRPMAFVTIGLPSSGKSTLARAIAVDDTTAIIERDMEREAIGNGSRQKFYRLAKESMGVYENAVSASCATLLRKAAKAGKNVFVSDTNTNRFNRHGLYRTLFDLGFRVHPVLMDVDLDTCLKRNLEREADHQVPSHVIVKMSDALEKDRELIEQEINVMTTYFNPDNADGDVVFDIDGTLADMNGNRGPFEWHRVGEDLPRHTVIELCNYYMETRRVVFFSGRDGVCREETLKWLRKYISPSIHESQLKMRKPGDQRVDWIVKGEIMMDYIESTGLQPSLCIDDRQQVVDIWRNMGFETWQVDAGKF